MSVAVYEQETIIQFSRDSKSAEVYTSDTTVMNRLDKLCEQSDSYTLIDTDVSQLNGEVVAKKYSVTDKSLISFRKNKSKRELTSEMREALSERMKKARDARLKNEGISDW